MATKLSKGSVIFMIVFILIAIGYVTYDVKRIEKARIAFNLQYPLLKKRDCLNDVVISMLNQEEHIMVDYIFIALKNNKNKTIIAVDYSGEGRYEFYNSVQVGDSIIKRCNSDSLIIKHEDSCFYFRIKERY